MPAVVITMLVVLVTAIAIIAIVWMGVRGIGRESHPELVSVMERTAAHLNGDAAPPRGLQAIVGELDELPMVNRRSAASPADPKADLTGAEAVPSPEPAEHVDEPQGATDAVAPAKAVWAPGAAGADEWAGLDPLEDTIVHAKLPGGRPRR